MRFILSFLCFLCASLLSHVALSQNISCPPDTLIDCGIFIDPEITGIAEATDSDTLFFIDSLIQTCPDDIIVQRFWIAINSSAETSDTCSQLITVEVVGFEEFSSTDTIIITDACPGQLSDNIQEELDLPCAIGIDNVSLDVIEEDCDRSILSVTWQFSNQCVDSTMMVNQVLQIESKRVAHFFEPTIQEDNGDSTGAISLAFLCDPVGEISFQWSDGSSSSSITNVAAGDYSVTVSNDTGCDDTYLFSVGSAFVDSMTMDTMMMDTSSMQMDTMMMDTSSMQMDTMMMDTTGMQMDTMMMDSSSMQMDTMMMDTTGMQMDTMMMDSSGMQMDTMMMDTSSMQMDTMMMDTSSMQMDTMMMDTTGMQMDTIMMDTSSMQMDTIMMDTSGMQMDTMMMDTTGMQMDTMMMDTTGMQMDTMMMDTSSMQMDTMMMDTTGMQIDTMMMDTSGMQMDTMMMDTTGMQMDTMIMDTTGMQMDVPLDTANLGSTLTVSILDRTGNFKEVDSLRLLDRDSSFMDVIPTSAGTGIYQFDVGDGLIDIQSVCIELEDEPRTDLSAQDIVVGQRQILQLIDGCPEDIVAGDVNLSGTLSAADLVSMRNVLLENQETFPAQVSWRFIEMNRAPTPQICAPISNSALNEGEVQIRAIKLGDLQCNE